MDTKTTDGLFIPGAFPPRLSTPPTCCSGVLPRISKTLQADIDLPDSETAQTPAWLPMQVRILLGLVCLVCTYLRAIQAMAILRVAVYPFFFFI